MDDAINLFIVKNRINKCSVTDIALIKLSLGMYCFNVSGFQIVCNDDLFACVNEFIYGMRADVTGTA